MNKSCFIFFVLICAVHAYGQQAPDQTENQKRFDQSEVSDSTGAINKFNRLVGPLGGDSTCYNASGNGLQGWHERFYNSGKLLHRGYYLDGKLITFKNYYENGQCERILENPDPLHCSLELFFDNGQRRKQISYYKGLPQKLYEFYENGQPKLAEENDKDMKYLTLKKSWYDNGYLQSDLEITDLKNKKYNEKIYYLNGKMKEEGTVILLSGTHEYVKEGTWFTYDAEGKNKKSEKHVKGIKLNSRQ